MKLCPGCIGSAGGCKGIKHRSGIKTTDDDLLFEVNRSRIYLKLYPYYFFDDWKLIFSVYVSEFSDYMWEKTISYKL